MTPARTGGETAGLGHNNGPSMEAGRAFRVQAWSKARADLIPNLPIEILRTRVRRARELGLPYKTYASVRASTGRDVVGFLFSNNALRVLRPGGAIEATRAAQLNALRDVALSALSHPPVTPEELAAQGMAHCAEAPHFSSAWSEIRRSVQAPLRAAKLPLDGVLVIGDTTFERDWSEAGKLAGFVNSDTYFASP